jgi:hypothetical protein
VQVKVLLYSIEIKSIYKTRAPTEHRWAFGLVEKGAEGEQATGLFTGPKRNREGFFYVFIFLF